MKLRMIIAFLVLLLPCIGFAENVIEVLPTSAPLPEIRFEEDEYAFRDLGPVYEGEYVYQTPGMTESEAERYAEAVSRYAAGERPDTGILDLTENVRVSVLRVPADQYEGENWFMFLPCRELTDEELLQIADAFAQMDEPFSPQMVNWHNCMRGGAEWLRSLTEEEFNRVQSVRELYNRGGLRPEQAMTPVPGDDGLGIISLEAEDYCGLESYNMFPARRLTDDELLRWFAYDAEEMDASVDELITYEGILRRELHELLGMSLLAVREYESIQEASASNVYGDTRKCYLAWFKDQETGCTYTGLLSIDTMKLVRGDVTLKDYWIDGFYSDIIQDPFSDHVKNVAYRAVVDLRADGENGIDRVEAWSDSTVNSLHCALSRIWTTDGSVYRTYYLYPTEEIVMIDYDDAESISHEDEFYIHMMN